MTSHMLFPRDRLFLIAGPCQLEDDALNLRVAESLARLADVIPGGIIFKGSFDKANRSNPGAARGLGLVAGLAALARVREATGLPVLTELARFTVPNVVPAVAEGLGARERSARRRARRRGSLR